LQNDLLANPPSFADSRIVDVKTQRGEVLAEETIRKLPAQPALPVVQVLTLKCINRLIIAAVVFAVADEISDESAPQAGGLWAWCSYLNGLIRRLLANTGPPNLLGRGQPSI